MLHPSTGMRGEGAPPKRKTKVRARTRHRVSRGCSSNTSNTKTTITVQHSARINWLPFDSSPIGKKKASKVRTKKKAKPRKLNSKAGANVGLTRSPKNMNPPLRILEHKTQDTTTISNKPKPKPQDRTRQESTSSDNIAPPATTADGSTGESSKGHSSDSEQAEAKGSKVEVRGLRAPHLSSASPRKQEKRRLQHLRFTSPVPMGQKQKKAIVKSWKAADAMRKLVAANMNALDFRGALAA